MRTVFWTSTALFIVLWFVLLSLRLRLERLRAEIDKLAIDVEDAQDARMEIKRT